MNELYPWLTKGQVICEDDVDGFRWYQIGGKKYISVTQVLEVAQHFRLSNWLKNNSKNKVEKTKKETAQLGTDLHKLVELDLNHEEPKEIRPELMNAFANWKKVKSEYEIGALLTEQTVVSDKYGYAGTVDMLIQGRFPKVNKPFAVADLKTGFFSVKAGYQIASYRQAIIEGKNAYTEDNTGMVGIQIHRDGSKVNVFEYEHNHYCFERFLYSLELFKGLYFSKLKKMGWEYLEKDSVKEWLGVIEHD